jgi:Domain of unknown function (DUF5092)
MLTNSDIENINRAESLAMDILLMGGPNISGDSNFHLDRIDATEVEPFTLEPFKRSILDTRKVGKDYIVARVTTSDPNNSSLLYNYYYSAMEINKILFKYESDRHLLHRMKVRNPLNNMFIMGQVYYYKVTSRDVDQGIYEYDHPDEATGSSTHQKAFSAIVSVPDKAHSEHTQIQSKDCYHLKTVSRDIFHKPSQEREGKADGSGRVRVRARYFATDTDFLLKASVREYFKQNALYKDDYFIFELERTHNDISALLETPDLSEDAIEVENWKRALTAHLSFILIVVVVLLFLGASPMVVAILFPLALFGIFSMGCSLAYVFCCRRRTFLSLDVNDVEEV